MKARDYQRDAKAGAYAALRKHRSAIIVMPTGTGKGAVIGQVIADAVKAGRRVLAMVHRKEIVDQLAEHVRTWGGVVPAIERAEQRESTDDDLVVVGSVPSIVRRLDRLGPDRFDLVIADESHHAVSASWVSVIEHFASAKVLGFTATPNRGDEKALGQIFEAVGYDMTLADAIIGGWLVPIKTEAIELKSLDLSKVRKRSGELAAGDLGAVMSEVKVLREAIVPAVRIAGSLQAIVFTVTRAHMRCVAETARVVAAEVGLDLPVACVDGTTPKAERARIMAEFRSGAIRWLINVGVATEGFDAPGIECVIGLRPTLSQALYMQMVGRGTRPLAGVVDGLASATERRAAIRASAKPSLLVLDFADNSGRHDVAAPIDLLGGDYSWPEKAKAAELLADGSAEDLLEALEMARAAALAKLAEARARMGDPFALFGISSPKDRWGRAPTAGQMAVLGPLKLPRVLDFREANAVLAELDRRERERLSLYSQAALLARLGHPVAELPAMPRVMAGRHLRAAATRKWRPE